jgi:hypothetical protein
MKAKIFVIALVAFCLAGCLRAPETIRDVTDLRQDHTAYRQGAESRDLISADNQIRQDEDYNIIYFSVWHQSDPFHAQAADRKSVV